MAPLRQPGLLLGLLLLGCTGTSSAPPEPPPTEPPPTDRFADRRAELTRDLHTFGQLAAPQGGGREDGRAVVARLEVSAPKLDRFVVHGTLPVPAGFDPGDSSRSPLAISARGPGAQLAPVQVNILTRSASGAPEVIAFAALIDRPQGVQPGAPLTLDVVEFNQELDPGGPALTEAVAELADPRGAARVLLRARDVHGNVYEADLGGAPDAPGFGSREVLRDGPVRRIVRTHATLVPVERSGEGQPRAHLMGVHAYWTLHAQDGRVGLDLRVHNGATSGSRRAAPEETPLGFIHWDALELDLPESWQAQPLVLDPFLGEERVADGRRRLPLVRRNDDGSLHMMPPQAQFQRRLTLTTPQRRAGDPLILSGLAFPRNGAGLWSWWNPATAHYFPQHGLLPDWSSFKLGSVKGERALQVRLRQRRDLARQTLETGKAQEGLIAGPLMGWAHPLGVSVQGMTGGSGIVFLEGHRTAAAASAAGIEALLLEHRMNASRMPIAQWDAQGQPVGVEAWLDGSGKVPFDFRTNGRMVPPVFRLPMFEGPIPHPQVRAVHLAERRPDYDRGSPHHPGGRLAGGDQDLVSWLPHDGQHFARWTKRPMALAWLTADALAIDDLRHAAETFHLMFHGEEHEHVRWSPGVTLLQFEKLVAAHPGHGMPVDRDHAWGIEVQCAAWLLADDGWRARRADWYRRAGQLMVDAAMPSGLVQRMHVPKLLGGRYGGAQAFECMFLLHAKRCLIESVLRVQEPALAEELAGVHQRALDYLLWGPVWTCFEIKEEMICGPRWHFATGPGKDWSEPPFSDETVYGPRYLPVDGAEGPVETTYLWAPMEYGMLLAQGEAGPDLDDRYLRRALTSDRAAGRWEALMESFFAGAQRTGNDLSGNWGSLIGRVQSLRDKR